MGLRSNIHSHIGERCIWSGCIRWNSQKYWDRRFKVNFLNHGGILHINITPYIQSVPIYTKAYIWGYHNTKCNAFLRVQVCNRGVINTYTTVSRGFSTKTSENKESDNNEPSLEKPITSLQKRRGVLCLTRCMTREFPIVLPTFVALMASSALISLFPTVVGRYINSFSAQTVPSMLQGGCFILGAALASFIKTTLSGFAKLRMSRRIREDMFDSLLKKDASFFDLNSSGKLASILATDAKVAAGIIDHLSQIVRASISFTAGIYFSLKIAHISLIIHTVLPIAGSLFIMIPLSRCVQRQTSLQMRHLAALVSYTEERVSHIKTVKTSNAEKFEATVFADKVRLPQ
ncbi:putative ATP-binding cassette [Babesia sp. Xinjiang]|uniref:putative ATP-binding cassette n=1 Tax=Babesia sp. Xinjiang TaxID=462227 RepID=UPI000A23B864|nr:putative ATP-binding cassette [Babesia sp. Xinjiang]ORM42071.1 putative ATP-binding cassette [Babesia sp. Xinjiang]